VAYTPEREKEVLKKEAAVLYVAAFFYSDATILMNSVHMILYNISIYGGV